MLTYLQEPTNLYFTNNPNIQNPMKLKQFMSCDPFYRDFLVMAPTCAANFQLLFTHLQRAGRASKLLGDAVNEIIYQHEKHAWHHMASKIDH
jgi:hypothetical protein